ncbi:hypothetical protein Tco_0077803 [Tanacetum coccineum]
MSDDIPRRTFEDLRIPNLYINNTELKGSVLYELQIILSSYSKTLKDFELPPLSERLLEKLRNKELMEEKSYNRSTLAEEVLEKLSFGKSSLMLCDRKMIPSATLKRIHTPRTLKDIMDVPDKVFGGKSVVLGGDFSQTLPVKKGGSKAEIITASIAQSHLWSHFKVYTLTENMRLQQPEQYCIPDNEDAMSNLINFMYDDQTLKKPNARDLQQKTIVCPRNNTTDLINSAIPSKVKGTSTVYKSLDKAIPVGNDGGKVELLYLTEYLNSLQLSGFPPHELELKAGVPIMLLRNVNLHGGLYRMTQNCISDLKLGARNKVLEARVYRKWTNRKTSSLAQTDYSCILIDRECMTRSLTRELFTPYEEPEWEFRSSRRHFKTLSLNELRSPDFILFSDQECSEEEEAETMAETMEQYMSKTRTDYGLGVARPKIDNKDQFELKGQFLKELRENTFSGSDHEDANEHIEKVLEIVDLFHVPNVTVDQLMLRVFPISLTGAASRWLRNEPTGSIKTWEDLKTKFLNKYCPPGRTAKKMEEINNFQQEPDETLYQAWERFKELLMKFLNTT